MGEFSEQYGRTDMGKMLILIAMCALTGCDHSTPKMINPEVDLDCGMVFLTAEKNEDQAKASAAERRAIYVFQTWYLSKVKQEQSADAQLVVELIKKDPNKVGSAMKPCVDRAMKDFAFERWAVLASKEFESSSR
jgi:hypothetical protein